MIPLELGQINPQESEDQESLSTLLSSTPARAAFESSWEDTPVGALTRIYAQREAEQSGGKPLTPNEANEMYPGMPKAFTHDVNPRVAQMMYDRNVQRQKYARIMDTAPDTLYGSLQTFGASTLPHLMDPIGFAAGALTGGAFAAAGIAGRTLGTRLALGTAENFIGNLAADAPSYIANDMDQKESSLGESLLMNAVASAGFAGIGVGIKAIANKFDGNVSRSMQEASIGRLLDGKDPSLSGKLFKTHLAAETSGDAFAHTPMAFDPKQKFHSASKTNIEFDSAEHAPLDVRGNGVYLTDNMNAANGAAARGDSSGGRVFSHDVSKLNLVDANGLVPDEVRVRMEEAYGDTINFEQPMSKILDDIAVRVEQGALPEEVFNRIDEALTDNGYDGFHYEMDKFLGEEHTRQNVVKVIDPNKLAPLGEVAADKTKVGKIKKEKLAKILQDNEKDAFDRIDPEAAKRIDAADTAPEPMSKPLADAEETLASLRGAEKLGDHADAEDIAMADKVQEAVDRAKKMPEVLKAAFDCM